MRTKEATLYTFGRFKRAFHKGGMVNDKQEDFQPLLGFLKIFKFSLVERRSYVFPRYVFQGKATRNNTKITSPFVVCFTADGSICQK